jgi:CRP-like cAMP-binding protein
MVPVEIIKECKAFKMFPDELIEEIASIGSEAKYKPNEMIFNIDEAADNMAVLMKGRVDIMATKRTQLIPLHTVYPGEAFGFSLMITPRFAGAAKAMEDSVVCFLPVDKMNEILEKDYKVGFQFMKHIALLILNRLLELHRQMDITGAGFM